MIENPKTCILPQSLSVIVFDTCKLIFNHTEKSLKHRIYIKVNPYIMVIIIDEYEKTFKEKNNHKEM